MTVRRLETSVFKVPTDAPEADGTLSWDSTTMVVVEAVADSGLRGLGYTYGSQGAAAVVHEKLAEIVCGRRPGDVRSAWAAMVAACRNLGLPGIAATAISAVDAALWDLFAKELGRPLYQVLGARREEVPVYGSGGFTSYGYERLAEQLAGWAAAGIPRVKMKIGLAHGSRPDEDLRRVEVAREAIGPEVALFVDANGAFTPKQAIALAPALRDLGVTYFEEPVSSDRLAQLALVRRQTALDVAAGEYGWAPWWLAALLDAEAVDVLQADCSRCCGITGWLEAAALAQAAGVAFSGHCCPALHLHAACAAPEIAHLEYFWDHVRIESLLFDGAPAPTRSGTIRPDPTRPGLGLELKRGDASIYAA